MNEETSAGPPPHRLQVDSGADEERLDRWLARALPEYSRSKLQEWIRLGRVEVEGRPVRSSQRVGPGQHIVLQPPPPVSEHLEPVEIPLNVIFEDEHLLVLVKPAGLTVHPGAGAPTPTLVHALLHRDPSWAPPGPPHRPGIVHRLDRDTSGLLLVARSPLAYTRLSRQISRHEVTRRYIALVWGNPELDAGLIEAPIGRDPRDRRRMAVVPGGRPANTSWRVLRRFLDTLTLLDLVLGTGRTHQIRVHLAHLGHPVFGDSVYGGSRGWLMRFEAGSRKQLGECLRMMRGQALHAYHLGFQHPVSGRRLRFEAPVPLEMDEVLCNLAGSEANR